MRTRCSPTCRCCRRARSRRRGRRSERAVSLAPGRLDYRLRYADITMLQGDENAAKRLLTPIAAIKSDSVSSAAAKERLERIEQYERDRQRVVARRSAEAAADASAT